MQFRVNRTRTTNGFIPKQFTHQTTVKEQNGNLDLSGDTWNTLPREHGIQCRRFLPFWRGRSKCWTFFLWNVLECLQHQTLCVFPLHHFANPPDFHKYKQMAAACLDLYMDVRIWFAFFFIIEKYRVVNHSLHTHIYMGIYIYILAEKSPFNVRVKEIIVPNSN